MSNSTTCHRHDFSLDALNRFLSIVCVAFAWGGIMGHQNFTESMKLVVDFFRNVAYGGLGLYALALLYLPGETLSEETLEKIACDAIPWAPTVCLGGVIGFIQSPSYAPWISILFTVIGIASLFLLGYMDREQYGEFLVMLGDES